MITENIEYDSVNTSLFDKGFLLLHAIFEQEAQGFTKTLRRKLLGKHEDRYQKAFNNSDIAKFGLISFLNNQTFNNILKQVFPEGYVFSNNFFYRSFKKCHGTKAHADHVYFNQPKPLVTTWVALDGITLDMGPLYVLSREESKKIITEEYLNQKINSNDSTNNEGWEKAVLDISVPVKTRELKIGDCYIFMSDVIHGTLNSNSVNSRLSLDFRATSNVDYDERWFTKQYTN